MQLVTFATAVKYISRRLRNTAWYTRAGMVLLLVVADFLIIAYREHNAFEAGKAAQITIACGEDNGRE